MWTYKILKTKYFHGVSSRNKHPYLLTSRYGKVRNLQEIRARVSLTGLVLTGDTCMRRIAFRILLAITGLVAVAQIGAAQVCDPVVFPPDNSFTLPNNRCGFPIRVDVVSNKECQDVVTLADGTTVTRITGRLVLSFTNTVTGFTITRNVSGPTTETVHPDGSGTFVGEGQNWFSLGPLSQANTKEPGLFFTSGLVVLQIAGGAVTDFSLNGTQVNGCELLDG
jgi:hypothetical protein